VALKKTNVFEGRVAIAEYPIRSDLFSLAAELLQHRRYHPVGKSRITA